MWNRKSLSLPLSLFFLTLILGLTVGPFAPARAQEAPGTVYTFDNGDTQGWTTVDLTLRPTYFQQEEHGSVSGVPRRVAWCGTTYDRGGGATDKGYGNTWKQYLISEPMVVAGGVSITYTLQYDVEQDYDWVYLQTSDDDFQCDLRIIRAYTGNSRVAEADATPDGYFTRTVTLPDYGSSPFRIRFLFVSDGGWSDEDQFINTDGAFRVDEVTVAGVTETFYAADPATWTWKGMGFRVGGEYRLVENPITETVPDPSVDSRYTGFSHWSQEWSWVAYDEATGRFPVVPCLPGIAAGFHEIGIVSPVIAIAPVSDTRYELTFDVYGNLPLENQIFYTFQVNAYATEGDENWRNLGYNYYSTEGQRASTFDITSLVDPGDTFIQVRLIGIEAPYYFTPNGLSTAAPYFDNIQMSEVGEEVPGDIEGTIFADVPDVGFEPLAGVTVSAYLVGSMEVAEMAVSDAAGHFLLPGLEPGEYTVSAVRPIGYSGESDNVVTLDPGGSTYTPFIFAPNAIVCEAKGKGWWKHQLSLNSPGSSKIKAVSTQPGATAMVASPVCDYLDVIETHFNGNLANPVIIYEPPQFGNCEDKLAVAADLLNLNGSAGKQAKARQQLMALLLNVAAEKISLMQPISGDGALVSQAITFCDNLIENGGEADWILAKDIAEIVNDCGEVPAGWIDLTTPIIAYSPDMGLGSRQALLAQNRPNPFEGGTEIRFRLPEPGSYTLSVFTVAGALVRGYNGWNDGTETIVTWDGRDDNGTPVAPGVYYYRLDSSQFRQTRKALLLH